VVSRNTTQTLLEVLRDRMPYGVSMGYSTIRVDQQVVRERPGN